MPKPIRVLFAVPRYKRAEVCSEEWQWDVLAAAQREPRVEVTRLRSEGLMHLFVDVAREKVCVTAEEQGFDVALMCDADCTLSGEDSLRMAVECHEKGYAILAAPISIRGGEHAVPNYLPWPEAREEAPTREELETYQRAVREGRILDCSGFVGTGVCAVGVAQLADMERPWLHRTVMERDRTGFIRSGVDVWFCRRALAAKKKVGMHLGLRSGKHYMAAVRNSAEMLDGIEAKLGTMLASLDGKPEAAA